ncbi:MAG: bifunctional homocysteine S-methyltransferase/methylenetetrahydrofolate reductase [Anaerolineae bacterium]|nr:bifunctional homocysteine S-methyltransferase/methylenetetrahydrofolate reductase [Anaerolineae bacterium]
MTHLSLSQRLAQPTPLLADGAMGTLLHRRGDLALTDCIDLLNLTHPDLVAGIHRDYIAAGADLIESNTFGANRYKLGEYGQADKLADIITAGVRLAQQAAADSPRPVYVLGSVGAIGVRLKPYGRLTREEAYTAFHEQISVLVAAGVAGIICETFADHEELLIAVAAARAAAPELPIIAQATFSGDSLTYTGHQAAQVAHDLHKSGATIIGVNCGNGPARSAQILQAMHTAVPAARLSVMPNAGFPENVGGRVLFPAQAGYFGDYVATFRAAGAQIIGGCCGTTPEHIAAMRQALDHPVTTRIDIQISEPHPDETDTPAERPTRLMQRLQAGEFTVTVEMTPPRSFTADRMLTQTRLLRDAGADLIDVADTPAAKLKMSAWAAAHLIQSRIGIETVLHFPTRGRNLLRVQGDLLAAHALGLRNLFVTMGDPTRIGDYPQANDTADLIDLIQHRMNQGHDMAGNSIGRPTTFTVGCALNMAADDADHEIKVLRKKLEAGADFALGQAVFDPPRAAAFLKRYAELEGQPLKLPVLMGVFPLYSVKHALFLHNEVPGISIPEAIFKRLEAAGDEAPREGIRIASELMLQLRDLVQGAYVIPAYGRYELAAELVDAIVNAPVGA